MNAAGFEIGMGVTVSDDDNGGFHTTVATITGKNGSTSAIDKPLNGDYMVDGLPMPGHLPGRQRLPRRGRGVESLCVDGNKEHNPPLNGCRGAGIFLYRGEGTALRDCHVRDYNGDGISFQQINDTVVERCECGRNAGLGLHPGSGSQRPIVLDCHCHDNGDDRPLPLLAGAHGLFEGNPLVGNGQYGISIGHKDTDNLFRRCVSHGNGGHGIDFRDESEPMAGHRNTFEDCRIAGNALAQVRIEGATRDTVLRRCSLGGQLPSVGPLAAAPTIEDAAP